jgi:Xaa-Pro dipeptidase
MPDFVPKFSLAERDARWSRVRSLMERDDIDVIFAPPHTGLFDMMQANVRYLTGIGGNHAMAAAVFPREGEVTAISSPDVHKQVWMERQNWVSDIRGISSGWGFSGEVVARLKELGGVKRLGVTGLTGNTRFPEGTTSHGIVERLREALPGVELVNANPLMEEARFVKSDEEIAFLRSAVGLVEASVDTFIETARPGVPENIAFARMQETLISGGGELPSMILWSMGNPQPLSNAYMPTRRPIEQGEIILMEAEARWAGYIAQNTHTFTIGKADDELKAMFDRQQEAIAKCYGMMRPGTTIREISDAMIAMSDDVYDICILMHSRGLGDDSPIAIYRPRDDIMGGWVLKENSAFIVKPLVQKKGSTKRVHWGDTVVVTDKGAQRLGTRPAQIIEIG